jgi:hypothetical protein
MLPPRPHPKPHAYRGGPHPRTAIVAQLMLSFVLARAAVIAATPDVIEAPSKATDAAKTIMSGGTLRLQQPSDTLRLTEYTPACSGPSGSFFVLNEGTKGVLKYGPSGQLEAVIRSRWWDSDRVQGSPQSVAYSFAESLLYVLEFSGPRVRVFLPDGEEQRSFLIAASARGAAMRCGPSNTLYVGGVPTRTGGRKKGDFIYRVTRDGETLCSFWTNDLSVWDFVFDFFPIHLAVDGQGCLYAGAFHDYSIRKFSPEGDLLREFSREAPFFRPPSNPVPRPVLGDASEGDPLAGFRSGPLALWKRQWTELTRVAVTESGLLLACFRTWEPAPFTIDIYNTDAKLLAGDVRSDGPLLFAGRGDTVYFAAEPIEDGSRYASIQICRLLVGR